MTFREYEELVGHVMICPGDTSARLKMKTTKEQYLSMLEAPITQGKGADKRWSTHVPDPSNKDGRRRIKASTREEVEFKVIQYFMNMETYGAAKKPDMMTFDDCWKGALAFKKDHNKQLKALSFTKFESDYRTYFEGTKFANTKITSINERNIEYFLLETIEKNGLTRKRACQIAGYIKSTMHFAYRERLIAGNPFERVDLLNVVYPACSMPRVKEAEERTLSKEQVKQMVNVVTMHISETPLYMPDYGILIAAFTGLRAGEIVALKWEDITDGKIRVCRSEHRTPNGDHTQSYVLGHTKTGKKRDVPISDDLQKVLNVLRDVQEENGIESEFILFDGNERPNAGILEKAAARRGKEAKIDGTLTIHRIRRTIASYLNTKFDRSTVAAIMGHTEEVDEKFYDYSTTAVAPVRKALNSVAGKACTQLYPEIYKKKRA